MLIQKSARMLAGNRRESDHGDLLIRLRRVYPGGTTCRMYLKEVTMPQNNVAPGLERYAHSLWTGSRHASGPAQLLG
jgi:hypothetical protein